VAGVRRRDQKSPRKTTANRAKVVRMEDLVIPELEEAKRKVTWRPWTPEEEAVLRRYYSPGMAQALVEYFAKHFPPGRSRDAIIKKAQALGLQTQYRKPAAPED